MLSPFCDPQIFRLLFLCSGSTTAAAAAAKVINPKWARQRLLLPSVADPLPLCTPGSSRSAYGTEQRASSESRCTAFYPSTAKRVKIALNIANSQIQWMYELQA